MTANETYNVLLEAIAEKLKKQQELISFYEWQVSDLKAKLAEAEKHIKKEGEA